MPAAVTRGVGWVALLATSLALADTPAYVRTHVTNGTHCLWWPGPTIAWQQGMNGNRDTGPSAFEAVTDAFATWDLQQRLCGSVRLEQGGKTLSRSVGWVAGGQNANVVLFRPTTCTKKLAPNSACWAAGACGNTFDCWEHASGLLGLTTVSYDTATGRIFDADIELNAAEWLFTTVNSPPCVNVASTSCVSTDVQNTVTHEVGHLLGLDHVPSNASTMSALASQGETNKRQLDPGTQSFVCAVYEQGLAPKDCVVEPATDTLGEVGAPKQGCASAPAGAWAAGALALLLARRRPARAARGCRAKQRWVGSAAAVLALVAGLAGGRAAATTLLAMELPDLVGAADVVVRGQVARSEVRWSEDRHRLITEAEVVVAEAWKGAPGLTVLVATPGGERDGVGQRVAGAPELRAGDELVLFLEARGPLFVVTGFAQGVFAVERDATGAAVARQASCEALLLHPATMAPVPARRLALPLDELRKRVRALVPAPTTGGATTAPGVLAR